MKQKKHIEIESPTVPSRTSRRHAVDLDKIQEGIAKYSRVPFTDILRQALSNTPDDDAILAMAQSDPLRWADYTTKIAKLYGYSEQSSVYHTHKVIHEMSTVEIEAELASLEQKALLAIDIVAKDVTPIKKT